MAKPKATSTLFPRPDRNISEGKYNLADVQTVIVDSNNPFEAVKLVGLKVSSVTVTDNSDPYGTAPFELEFTFTTNVSKVNVGEWVFVKTPEHEFTGHFEVTAVGANTLTTVAYKGTAGTHNFNSQYTYAKTYPFYGGYFLETEDSASSGEITDEAGNRTLEFLKGEVKSAQEITFLSVDDGIIKLYLL